jgi:hypothetical protein
MYGRALGLGGCWVMAGVDRSARPVKKAERMRAWRRDMRIATPDYKLIDQFETHPL